MVPSSSVDNVAMSFSRGLKMHVTEDPWAVRLNCASCVHNIFTTVMTPIDVDKSTDPAR